MTQTSDTAWTLEKIGTATRSSITWGITATETATVAGQLLINGTITVENTGTGGATIGNIVVNLQTKSGSGWVTRSSDVADATNDDDATTAKIMAAASSENQNQFSENSASGHLLFMDAATNSIFSLVPQVTIPGGTIRTLLFTASFDNNVLNLATGTATRAEMIVSFGNATSSGNSVANVDINGNGIIDSDEARIRSVPSRLGLSVPAQQAGNSQAQVTLSDTLDDITSTGTVTFGNAVFNLGATSGTVSVTYSGGTNGGTLTNCAHLTSPGTTVTSGGFTFPGVDALDLQACDTQTIGGHACTPGAPGCGWEPGDMLTFNQNAWGDSNSGAGALLTANFTSVYGVSGGVEVGIPGAAGFSMLFTLADAVFSYLPQVDPVGLLTADLQDPTSSSSGALGGDVLALELNVAFSDADLLGGGTALGDLRICSLSSLPQLNGQTVRQFLATANTILGGGSATFGASAADSISGLINNAFADGSPSVFAQNSLFVGSCP